MTDLTEATKVDAAYLAQWYALQERMRQDRATEAMMRSRIYETHFPDAKAGLPGTEGTNNYELNDGTGAVLKAKRTVDRKVDEPALDAYKAASKEEGSNLPKLPWNKLVKYKPELVKAEYNKLTAEEQAACDQVLIIKDGSPQLEIVIPKKRGG
jgi:hypothetical protein